LIKVEPRWAWVVIFVDGAFWTIMTHGAITGDSRKAFDVTISANRARFAVRDVNSTKKWVESSNWTILWD